MYTLRIIPEFCMVARELPLWPCILLVMSRVPDSRDWRFTSGCSDERGFQETTAADEAERKAVPRHHQQETTASATGEYLI